MNKLRINIAIVEPSDMVFEGLATLLLKTKSQFYIYRANTLEELSSHCSKEEIDIAIINPVVVINMIGDFAKLRKSYDRIKWIALVYSYFEKEVLAKFEDVISIGDSAGTISKRLVQAYEKYNWQDSPQENLSERELEVLAQLVKGLSNKEIANKLHISIHTVISHRKNIVEKTGIKSLPGLTIFAISKKIIPLDSM